ncbi:helix-turn-helix transcriptional regulator [Paenibacillus sp. H1-7]|uniref:helix-turn-helix domain-containing protein n=1 Tax=Paenibacillus sp. H1-7 TaxID=2282849 RepID=UPI001EF8F9EE|nr:helix-turn-helix transcriptional regulator [Paenibacillus sp. H1-7]
MEKRITQEQLAVLVNKSKQVISNWERGYSKPVDDDLASLSSALDVSVDFILGKTDDPTPAATKEKTVAERKAAAMIKVAEKFGFDLEKEEDYKIIEQLLETAAKIRGL